MKRMTSFTLIGAFLLVGTVLAAESPGRERGRKQGNDGRDRPNVAARVDVHVAFGPNDVVILREFYAPRYSNLPHGLQKKVARGGRLPPGWQKKIEPFPVAIERRLAPLSSGYRRGVIDGHGVIYNARTNVIVDLAVRY